TRRLLMLNLAVLAGLGVGGCASDRPPQRAVAPDYPMQVPPPATVYRPLPATARPAPAPAPVAAAEAPEPPPLLARPEEPVEAPQFAQAAAAEAVEAPATQPATQPL